MKWLTVFILTMSIVAVNSSNGSIGGPLNCVGSQSTKRPSTGEKICKELSESKPPSEDLVFECACALAAHTIWYKNITNQVPAIKQAIWAADLVIVAYTKNHQKEFSGRDPVLFNEFPDRVQLAMALSKMDKKRLTNAYLLELDAVYYIMTKSSWARQDNPRMEQGKKLARETCNHLAGNERMYNLIRPSLRAIEASSFGGAGLRRFLTVSQPELGQLVALANFCIHVISI